jgi:hypothetical protein
MKPHALGVDPACRRISLVLYTTLSGFRIKCGMTPFNRFLDRARNDPASRIRRRGDGQKQNLRKSAQSAISFEHNLFRI